MWSVAGSVLLNNRHPQAALGLLHEKILQFHGEPLTPRGGVGYGLKTQSIQKVRAVLDPGTRTA